MRSSVFLSLMMLTEVVFSADFSVKIPKAVSAVAGSCAEIRCTFDYPDYRRIADVTWLKWEHTPGNQGFSIIYDSKDSYRQHYNYRGRAEFKGNIEKKQCSLLLKDIRKSDQGTYELSIEIASESYINGPRPLRADVFLSVLEKPEISGYGELTAGQTARLTCSVTHNCPDGNLKLKWIKYNVPLPPPMDTQDGAEISKESFGSRTVSSVITFTPSSAHDGKILGCTILIDGIPIPSAQYLTLEITVLGIFSRTIFLIIGVGAIGLYILIAVVLTLKIKRKKHGEAARGSVAHDDLVIYSTVQKALNDDRDDQCTEAGRGAAQSTKPAQNDEIAYATINVSNFRKHDQYIQNEETSEYAAIKQN